MVWAIPGFKVSFSTPRTGVIVKDDVEWHVSGEENVDVLCKILRRNGITTYTVKPDTNPFDLHQTVSDYKTVPLNGER